MRAKTAAHRGRCSNCPAVASTAPFLLPSPDSRSTQGVAEAEALLAELTGASNCGSRLVKAVAVGARELRHWFEIHERVAARPDTRTVLKAICIRKRQRFRPAAVAPRDVKDTSRFMPTGRPHQPASPRAARCVTSASGTFAPDLRVEPLVLEVVLLRA